MENTLFDNLDMEVCELIDWIHEYILAIIEKEVLNVL